MEKEYAYSKIEIIRNNIHRDFVGKEKTVELLLVSLLAGGHVLLEDVPGVGKTMLAKTLAKATGLSLSRIQFTPDTLPSDVVGLSIYNMKTGEFEWKNGAVMNQLILADEINRTPPKTQACLLEAMAEGQISADGISRQLPEPFMVIATQNPLEYVGTYPLPEAQLDRFLMQLSLGYPEKEEELKIIKDMLQSSDQTKASKEVGQENDSPVSAKELCEIKRLVMSVHIDDAVIEYIEEIIKKTREERRFRLGASTRALLALTRAAQAFAFLSHRDFVKPDDVKYLVKPVLAHRMLLSADAKRQKNTEAEILSDLLSHVRVPV